MAKQAAVNKDIFDKKLGDISAAEFLSSLNNGSFAQYFGVWPEKKKLELELEPVVDKLKGIKISDFLDLIRGEKKKVELEKFPGFERWRDPREIYEGINYDILLDRLAKDLEQRFRR
jgi:hypothetical protein